MRDISDGGIGVILDAGYFERGTQVFVESEGLIDIEAWVCHSTSRSGSSFIGLSFTPVDRLQAEECFDRALCDTM